jgi:hypothetical protein
MFCWRRSTEQFYKHTAPLGQWNRQLAVLQTYCPAGAGEPTARDSTNILPRWGRNAANEREANGRAPNARDCAALALSGQG